MKALRLIPTAAWALILVTGCGKDSPTTTPHTPVTLASAVEAARVRHHLPAIAAASFSLDAMEVAASGVRRLNTGDVVTASDLFHVGSLAKGMTATAIAELVEDGLLDWSITLAEAFPEFAATMDPAYRAVSLAALLQNRGGVPGMNELEEFFEIPEFPGDLIMQRRAFAGWVLSRPPAVPPGTYLYSTAGFAIAAAIAEGRTGRAWADELRTDLLDPLGVTMYVGWPLEAGPDQPCGHMMDGDVLRPVEPHEGHVPAVLAPGGDVSMSVRDFARYAQLHLQALCGRPSVLDGATWRRLHEPNGDYAMGWSVLESGGNTVLTHTGSPATFYAVVVLYKNQGHGFVVLMNADTPERDDAVVDIITAMAPSLGSARAEIEQAPGAGRHGRTS